MGKTFKKRKYSGDINETIELVKESQILKTNWKKYSMKNDYARTIEYEDIMNCLEKIIEVIKPVVQG